jgi:hypothetical protein
MSTDNEENVPDSEACSSDENHDGPKATDDDASPSLYKKSRCNDDDNGEQANDYEGSSDASIDHDRMNSNGQEAALKVVCKQLLRHFDQMPQDLKTIMQIQHNATRRKKGAELPAPEPKRRAPFTPPRTAPISVQASQHHYSEFQ